MTSNHHALYDLGYTYYNGVKQRKQDREVEQNSETTSQFGLQAATRLHEVGIAVIADRHTANTFPGLVHTARHTMSRART